MRRKKKRVLQEQQVRPKTAKTVNAVKNPGGYLKTKKQLNMNSKTPSSKSVLVAWYKGIFWVREK